MDDAPANLNPNFPEPVVDSLDFAEYFATDNKFSTRDDLLKWVRDEAAKLGFAIIIVKSDHGSDKRKQTLVLGCERGGGKKQSKGQDIRSIKCGCPFRLRGYFLSSGVWTISVVCGTHNHVITKNLEGRSIANRLDEEERKLVHEMTSNMVQPKKILMTLKKRKSDNVSNIKQIYNERHRYNKSIKGSITEMQNLMDLLVEDDAPNEDDPEISVLFEAIQVRLKNADYNTRIHIKEQLRQMAYPETTPPLLCLSAEKENEFTFHL